MIAIKQILIIFLLISNSVIADSKKDNAEVSRLNFFQELENFTRIFNTIKYNYVDEISHKDLFNKAIKGMMLQLDPHSSYLEPKEKEDLLENSSGKFGGLGIVITMENSLVKIISPIDDTPAYKAGLNAGDLIIKIDDTSVRGLDLSDAVDMMRGEPGTTVTITISRDGAKPFKVKIVRDIITITSVKGYLIEKDIAYIRISSFQSPSAKLLKNSLDNITKDNDNMPIKGLIIDIRNNPGGLLNSAVHISDLFLSKNKLIVYTKGRTDNSSIRYHSITDDTLNGTPIVVLINRGSASASEIVSGALQDNKRAVIIGEKSFGKGSVQTVTPLRNDYALKITTARYYTPSGRSIQAKGIEPDIKLEKFELKKDGNTNDFSESEKDLKGHIDATKTINTNKVSITIAKNSSPTLLEKQNLQKQQRDKGAIKRLKNDYYINQAINALKIMNIKRAPH